ncbi:MAG: bifunctional diguanylate cyclase/phosphodiesterase [bacterium]
MNYSNLTRNSKSAGIKILFDDDLTIINFTQEFYKLTGYSNQEFFDNFNNKFLNLINHNNKNNLIKSLNYNKNKSFFLLDLEILDKHGDLLSLAMVFNLLDYNFLEREKYEFDVYQLTLIDKTTDNSLLQQFNQLEVDNYRTDLINILTNELIFEYQFQNNTILISKNNLNIFKQITGFDFSDKTFDYLLDNNIITNDVFDNFKQEILNLDYNTKLLNKDIQITNKDGIMNWAYCQCVIIRNPLDLSKIQKLIFKIYDIEKYKFKIDSSDNITTNINSNISINNNNNKDILDKIYDRASFEEIVNSTLNKNHDKDQQYALCIIDVDYFKIINDTFGHMFGDKVLEDIVEDILKCVDEDDLVGRVGGDEFAVLIKINTIKALERKIRTICDKIKNIYISDQTTHKISSSIGIALSPKYGVSYQELVKNADLALYNIKANGRNNFQFYNKSLMQLDIISKQNNSLLKYNRIRNHNTTDMINIINFFMETKGVSIATQVTLEMICKTYKLDRVCSYVKDNLTTSFVKIYEHNASNYSMNITNQLNLKETLYLTSPSNESLKLLQAFSKFYHDKKYIYTDNINSIIKEFAKINFEQNKDFETKEFYSYYFSSENNILGYITLEKYNLSEKLTQLEITEITTICQMLNNRIAENELKKKLKRENEIYKLIISNRDVSIYVVKKNTYEILFFNEQFKSIVPNVKIGSICYKLKGRNTPCSNCYIYSPTTITHKYFMNTDKVWTVDCTPSTWDNGIDAYIVCAKDTTDSTLEEDFEYMDLLTKAPSLEMFKKGFQDIVKSNLFEQLNYSLFVLDIDNFKYINNIYGYTIGDEILRQLSNNIKNFIKLDEIYCRISDDKFAILITYRDEDHLKQQIKSLNKMFEKMQRTHFNKMKITIICGVYKLSSQDIELNFILDKANIARKNAKGSIKNVFKEYDSNLNATIEKQNFIEDRILSALENDEFIPYLQPKFNLYTKEIYGAEALVRWQSSDRMIYPDEFVHIFEKNGFIMALDFIIYEKVMKYMKSCLNRGLKIIPISLNVSRGHIIDNEFTEKVLTLINKYEIPISMIEMEITENSFAEDALTVREFINNLRKENIKVSVDDFGTAYSSLNILKDLEVDAIKLDKGFLQTMEHIKNSKLLEKDKIIVKHIVEMCRDLKINIICEGIETLEQINFLKDIGCEYGQGYIFSKPISIQEFEKKFII